MWCVGRCSCGGWFGVDARRMGAGVFNVLRYVGVLRLFYTAYTVALAELWATVGSRFPAWCHVPGGRATAAWVVGVVVGVVASGSGLGAGVFILLLGVVSFVAGRYWRERSDVCRSWADDRAVGADSIGVACATAVDDAWRGARRRRRSRPA